MVKAVYVVLSSRKSSKERVLQLRVHYITTQPLISYYALPFRFRSTDKPYLALILQATLNKLQYSFGTQTRSIVSFLGPLLSSRLSLIA